MQMTGAEVMAIAGLGTTELLILGVLFLGVVVVVVVLLVVRSSRPSSPQFPTYSPPPGSGHQQSWPVPPVGDVSGGTPAPPPPPASPAPPSSHPIDAPTVIRHRGTTPPPPPPSAPSTPSPTGEAAGEQEQYDPINPPTVRRLPDDPPPS